MTTNDRTDGRKRWRIRTPTTIAVAVAMLLTAVPATAPTVSADHFDCLLHGEGEDCTEPLMDHFGCEGVDGTIDCALKLVGAVTGFVSCLFNTPPNNWVGTCTFDVPPG